MEVRTIRNDELCHHGVKGQRWGIRRYQNADGSLKDASKKRYVKSTLRRNEIRYGEENSRRVINKEKFEKYSSKAAKAKAEGNNVKAAKLKAKATEHQNLMNKSIKEMKAAESANWKTIAKAVQNNYDVQINTGQGLYYSKKGRQYAMANNLLFGAIGGSVAYATMANDSTGKYATRINTYKVKKRKDNTRGNLSYR